MSYKSTGRPLKFATVGELQTKIDQYFESCWQDRLVRDNKGNVVMGNDGKPLHEKAQVKPYAITGLAVALDTTRETLLDYQNSVFGEKLIKDNEELFKGLSDAIKRAKETIKEYAESSLYTIKNPAGAIFNLKANWGFQDTQKVDLNVKSLADTLKDLGE